MAAHKNLLAQEAALSSQQQALEHSPAGVRVHIAEVQNVKAATYNLPSEILSAIFNSAALDETLFPMPCAEVFLECSEQPLPILFELLVSAVSRRWRNVALQMPRLWTNLWINFA